MIQVWALQFSDEEILKIDGSMDDWVSLWGAVSIHTLYGDCCIASVDIQQLSTTIVQKAREIRRKAH